MLYKSIMHHTVHFPHTQRMASDATHYALLHTAQPPYSIRRAYGNWCCTPCSMRVLCTTLSTFCTHNKWQVALHTMLCHTLHLSMFYTHSIWQMTLHTMLYESIMHHTIHFLHTQYMNGDASYHAVLEYHALYSPFSTNTKHMADDASHHALSRTALAASFTHTIYGKWCSTQCSITHCALPFSMHTAYGRSHHGLWEYSAPHPPFCAHTTNGRWRYTLCSITRWNSFIFHTHTIWQLTIHTMLYASMMHQWKKGKNKRKEKKLWDRDRKKDIINEKRKKMKKKGRRNRENKRTEKNKRNEMWKNVNEKNRASKRKKKEKRKKRKKRKKEKKGKEKKNEREMKKEKENEEEERGKNGKGKAQHLAGDARHQALLHIAPLHLTYTQHITGDAPHHALWKFLPHHSLWDYHAPKEKGKG